jgi:anion-transporting  ArsA/GET3 family ATPase
MNNVTGHTEVIVCVGAGGVGKTTLSSLLAIDQAIRHKKVLLITIDPARRLLDVLGLKKAVQKPSRVDLSPWAKKNEPLYLDAYMPNLEREWQDFIRQAIEEEKIRHDIENNHFYSYMTKGFPGSLEIITTHVLYRFLANNEYDLIVLDTPPSSHSVAFFDVPKKIASVLEHNLFRTLSRGRKSFLLKMTKKLALFSGGILERSLEKLIGSHFLSELIDFAVTIDGLYEPLLIRSRAMEKLLKEAKLALVMRPDEESLPDAKNLRIALAQRGLKLDSILINQVLKGSSQKINQEKKLFSQLIEESSQDAFKNLIDAYLAELFKQNRTIDNIRDLFSDVKVKLIHNAEGEKMELLRELHKDFAND